MSITSKGLNGANGHKLNGHAKLNGNGHVHAPFPSNCTVTVATNQEPAVLPHDRMRLSLFGGLSNMVVEEIPEMVDAQTPLDGFSATLKAMKEHGLDFSKTQMALFNLFYTSGVAFAKSDSMSEQERQLWRNSIVWPIKNDKDSEEFEVHINLVKINKTPKAKVEETK